MFVPAATQEQIDDPHRDWEPGYPPELNYMSMRANYNVVITWGYRFDFQGRPTKAEPELLSWLDEIRLQVDRIIDSWRDQPMNWTASATDSELKHKYNHE